MMDRTKATIVGNAYGNLKSLVERYAEEDVPVLFTGESGSGENRPISRTPLN